MTTIAATINDEDLRAEVTAWLAANWQPSLPRHDWLT